MKVSSNAGRMGASSSRILCRLCACDSDAFSFRWSKPREVRAMIAQVDRVLFTAMVRSGGNVISLLGSSQPSTRCPTQSCGIAVTDTSPIGAIVVQEKDSCLPQRRWHLKCRHTRLCIWQLGGIRLGTFFEHRCSFATPQSMLSIVNKTVSRAEERLKC